MPAFLASSSCGWRTRGSGAVDSTMMSGLAVSAAFMPCTHSAALRWFGFSVKFMPSLSPMDFMLSWMFWLNGFGTRGMRNMLLPLSEDGSIGSPGGVNSGRPLYLSTFAVTSPDPFPPAPPLDADPPDPDPVLHAVRARDA